MYDMKWIRDNPEAFDTGLKRRGLEAMSSQILEMDKEYRALQTAQQELQSKRNALSSQIGIVKKQGGDVNAIMHEVAEIKNKMTDLDEQVRKKGLDIFDVLSALPNTPDASCPEGLDDKTNVVIRQVGQKPVFKLIPKPMTFRLKSNRKNTWPKMVRST